MKIFNNKMINNSTSRPIIIILSVFIYKKMIISIKNEKVTNKRMRITNNLFKMKNNLSRTQFKKTSIDKMDYNLSIKQFEKIK